MTEGSRQAFLELDLVSIEKASIQENGEANRLMQDAVHEWQQTEPGNGHGTVLETLLDGLAALTHPFRRDAVDYLEQFKTVDQPFREALSKKNFELKMNAIVPYVANYGIARNFPGSITDHPDKYRQVLELLETTGLSSFDNIADRVLAFEQRLHTAYGGNRRLSAASKLLWAFNPDHSIIIDSRTADALAINPHRSTYAKYVKLWLEGYETAKEQIAEVCADLPAEGEVKTATSKDWFHKRVFDWHLMRLGDRWNRP